MPEVSTKPYFIRAIYDWCSDCGFTPYLSVKVDERTRVPAEHVKNGEIVLNVSLNATRNLTINNELVHSVLREAYHKQNRINELLDIYGNFLKNNPYNVAFQNGLKEAQKLAAASPATGFAEPAQPASDQIACPHCGQANSSREYCCQHCGQILV